MAATKHRFKCRWLNTSTELHLSHIFSNVTNTSVFTRDIDVPTTSASSCAPRTRSSGPTVNLKHNSNVRLDPENELPQYIRAKFQDLHDEYDEVFDPQMKGYSGAAGSFEAEVNMGSVEPL